MAHTSLGKEWLQILVCQRKEEIFTIQFRAALQKCSSVMWANLRLLLLATPAKPLVLPFLIEMLWLFQRFCALWLPAPLLQSAARAPLLVPSPATCGTFIATARPRHPLQATPSQTSHLGCSGHRTDKARDSLSLRDSPDTCAGLHRCNDDLPRFALPSHRVGHSHPDDVMYAKPKVPRDVPRAWQLSRPGCAKIACDVTRKAACELWHTLRHHDQGSIR